MSRPAVLVLFGPTGVGKTEIIAQFFHRGFEIVVADSMQVYRHVDIGSAKPDAAVLRRLKHHLLGIVEPSEQFTGGDFVRRAEAAIAEIRRRGAVPLISGGTAYYLRNLVFGLPDGPGGDERVRRDLEAELQRDGLEGLRAELERVDPESAAIIPRKDTYRTLRTLEIFRSTGRRRSTMRVPQRPRRDFPVLLIGLERNREELRRRIDRRVDRMFDAGLMAEVKGLMRRGYTARDPGMRGIGYREFFEMKTGCLGREDTRAAIKGNSRRYAKRQMTFFRSLPGVRWFDAGDTQGIQDLVHAFVEGKAELDHAHEVFHNAASPSMC